MFTYTTDMVMGPEPRPKQERDHHRLIGFVLLSLTLIIGIGQYLVRMLLTIQ
jgi:hypothetical protein